MRLSRLIAIGTVVCVTGCGGGGGGNPTMPTVAPPQIQTQPRSLSVQNGRSASFSVTATGTGPLSYQWSRNGSAISGATGSTFTIPAVSASDNGASFTVVVSSSSGSTTSSAATLTITFAAASGVAQKGPLQAGSAVTAQELTANLSSSGKQYSYEVTSNLGAFSPTATFGSPYIGLTATGYYFDEIENSVSAGTTTLNSYGDLSADSVLNVNLLTTLAYQRTQHLVSSGSTVADAKSKAEAEVLAALNIPSGSYGSFGTLDISGGTDGDHILTAISSIFLYGNSAGQLNPLIASFQGDIGTNGAITRAETQATLATAAMAVSPTAIAASLNREYVSAGVTFAPTVVSDWIDQDGDGVVGRFKFVVSQPTELSVFTFPFFVINQVAGTSVSVTVGQLSVNGVTANGAVLIHAGDAITLSPNPGSFPTGGFVSYLLAGSTRIARVSFLDNAWSATGNLSVPRLNHSATLLLNGKVLVAGGQTPNGPTVSTELYDPVAGTWTSTGGLATPRFSHTATLLRNGKVLVAGGSDPSGNTLAAEVYDPVAGTWTLTGSLSGPHESHTATLLQNGMVLVAGGFHATITAELYDPVAGTWATTGSLITPRYYHTATLLQNGMVLVAGGDDVTDSATAAAELYDPVSGKWSATGSLMTSRDSAGAALLTNGKVVVMGGGTTNQPGQIKRLDLASAELYDPLAGTWAVTGNLSVPRSGPTATRLPSGQVLVVGGGNNYPVTAPPAYAETYDPVSGTWSRTGNLVVPRLDQVATMLQDGVLMVVGGGGTAILSSAELY